MSGWLSPVWFSFLLATLSAAMAGCPGSCRDGQQGEDPPAGAGGTSGAGARSSPSDEPAGRSEEKDGGSAFAETRARMVREQMRDIDDARVLEAMKKVRRHLFVPEAQRRHAYEDRPLSIGHEQTISQPYIVAKMTELADVGEGDTVLEVGTGSGYQAAVLAALGATVYTIEIVEPLAETARARLARLGYDDVHVRHGDGYEGWSEHAPYEAVVVTAAPPEVPPPLKHQLAVGGRLVVPVGEWQQELAVITRKSEDEYTRHTVFPVRFVPMTGKARQTP